MLRRHLTQSPEYLRGYVDGYKNRGAIVREVIYSSRYLVGYKDGKKAQIDDAKPLNKNRLLCMFLVISACSGIVVMGHQWIEQDANVPQGSTQQVEASQRSTPTRGLARHQSHQ
ncbi:MAG: hypothetical protein MUF49_31010 [Oculatellaceae cyanobacterium Prado106]|jgi:hypothetical protein|nr:hypothetical protein [Oculatellaceae cyanobacterium Prado106]